MKMKTKTNEQILLQACVKQIYNNVINDNEMLQTLINETNLSEFELMNAFENISIDNEFELDNE